MLQIPFRFHVILICYVVLKTFDGKAEMEDHRICGKGIQSIQLVHGSRQVLFAKLVLKLFVVAPTANLSLINGLERTKKSF